MEQTPDSGGPVEPRSPDGRTRTGRVLAVAVAAVEAAAAAGVAVLSLLSALDEGSLVLGAAVAGVAGGVAYLLAESARGFARGRRWPSGIFVTVQVLVGLVALSLGGRALLTAADNPRIALVTVAALALAAAGLVGVWLLAKDPTVGGTSQPDEPPPVF